ncbi:hypothetical protein FQN49_000208 [Arthroderma sp. PD_2]|nr:hypothetical protein FQN49_000208 [Arthroderma sp. PD_2]
MKLFTILSVTAALCGFAAAAPTEAATSPLAKRELCEGLHDLTTCIEAGKKFMVCKNQKPTVYECDGDCIIQIDQPRLPNGLYQVRCDNGRQVYPPV